MLAGSELSSDPATSHLEGPEEALATYVYTGSVRLDKRQGQGEDADPLVVQTRNHVVLGVFDGLGGAGSEMYASENGVRSGAAIGSEIASRVCRDTFQESDSWVSATAIKSAIVEGLDGFLRIESGEGSPLRGRLLRKLPTTVAIVQVRLEAESSAIPRRLCHAHWAGDSRIYILNSLGLRQLTRDHLSVAQSALENLSQDSELSNCAQANADFFIESVSIDVGDDAFLAIAASDGVFGYLPTPMHFEWLLLTTMAKASSFDDWKAALADEISGFTQDDATLAFAAVGWRDFSSMTRTLELRCMAVSSALVSLDQAAAVVQETRAAAVAAVRELEELRESQWDQYRRQYEYVAPTERS